MKNSSSSLRAGIGVITAFVLFNGLMWKECTECAAAALLCPPDEISPDAPPEIQRVNPSTGVAGKELTLEIEGKNFSPGVYVSFSHPAVRVLSTSRVSGTKLETRVVIAPKAAAGTLALFVSNPAGTVAETPFVVTAAASQTALPAQPAAAAPASPEQPAATAESPAGPVPEVTSVNPASAVRGSQLTVKVTGKNFVSGAKVAFSNPGIRVSGTVVEKNTELRAEIQVAPDAPTGPTGLFVVNPDDTETEVPFQVTEPASSAQTAASVKPASTSAAVAESLRFDVMNVGEVISILQTRERPKGVLSFAAGKLRYEESGKEVFSAATAEVQEIGVNTILGVNTGTFRVNLTSGQSYNFVAASLKPSDSQSIVDTLRRALH